MNLKFLSVGSLVLFLAACCPTKQEMAPVVLNVADKVFFDLDKADLRPEGKQVLDDQAAWFAEHPGENLVIEGHTDVRGSDKHNMDLGERRAKAARDYLVKKGVSADRIRTVSFGETRPDVVNAKTEADHQLNRRAVTILD